MYDYFGCRVAAVYDIYAGNDGNPKSSGDGGGAEYGFPVNGEDCGRRSGGTRDYDFTHGSGNGYAVVRGCFYA